MRNDKKPQLSDLRESGSIEQDADVVFLVHRPDFYDKEDRPGEADIIMAKHRNGPTETFHLAFLGATSKFKDMPQDYSAIRGCDDGKQRFTRCFARPVVRRCRPANRGMRSPPWPQAASCGLHPASPGMAVRPCPAKS